MKLRLTCIVQQWNGSIETTKKSACCREGMFSPIHWPFWEELLYIFSNLIQRFLWLRAMDFQPSSRARCDFRWDWNEMQNAKYPFLPFALSVCPWLLDRVSILCHNLQWALDILNRTVNLLRVFLQLREISRAILSLCVRDLVSHLEDEQAHWIELAGREEGVWKEKQQCACVRRGGLGVEEEVVVPVETSASPRIRNFGMHSLPRGENHLEIRLWVTELGPSPFLGPRARSRIPSSELSGSDKRQFEPIAAYKPPGGVAKAKG